MENFIISIIILSVLFVFVGINSSFICSICDDILKLIDEGKIEEAIALWEKKSEYIAFFVRDAEIDCVDTAADGFGGDYSLEDGETELKKLSFREAVSEIKKSEMPSLTNIFCITDFSRRGG